MLMKDISIIIPVYNAEKFLPRCLDSVLAEKTVSLELILVNDGSSDASGAICARYAANDSRVVYMEQENCGTVAARNRGMDVAQGTHLLFIDADDYVSPGYVGLLYKEALATSADIVFCHTCRERGGEIIEHTSYAEEMRTSLSERLALLKEVYYPGPWAKVFRRDLLENNGIRFLSEQGFFGFAEDMLFALHSVHAAEKIAFCPTATYFYSLGNENSLCSDPSIQQRNNDDRLIIIGHMLAFAKEHQLNGEALLSVLQAVENHLRWGGEYTLTAFLSRLDQKDLPAEIKEHFRRFAVNWRGGQTLYQRRKSKLKAILLRIPMLNKWIVTLCAFWRGHTEHPQTTERKVEHRDK